MIKEASRINGIKFKQAFKECTIAYKVNMEVKDNTIIISPIENQKRKGWAEAFQEMAKNGDDELVIPGVFEDEDLSDWTWK